MQVQWTFEGCADTTKEKCRAYWKKKQERLQRLLTGIPADTRKLRLAVCYQEEQINTFEMRGVLRLPGRTLAAQYSHHQLSAAVDGLADKLVTVILKYKQQSTRFIRRQRRHRISEDLAAVQPLLVSDKKADRKESFFTTIRPLLGFLERHAKNEIKIYEMEGTLNPGQVDPVDMVNEVIVLAWENFDERPTNLSLELWLAHLLHEILGRVESEKSLISLDQSFHLADIDFTAEPDWFEEVLGYQEEISLAELLPDYTGTEIWEQLDNLDRNFHFYTVLQKFPSYQRQAYLLHALNGYSLVEVAQIQERDVNKVENDINISTEKMRDYMQKAGFIQGGNLQTAFDD